MREHKYRCWDKYEKKWVLPKQPFIPCVVNYPPTVTLCRLEWVEFTGLKDKNGKEIYEGDILKSRSFFDQNMVVFYDSGCCSYDLRSSNDDSWDCSEHLVQVDKDDLFQWEVLGNVYEHPHLLTNPQQSGS